MEAIYNFTRPKTNSKSQKEIAQKLENRSKKAGHGSVGPMLEQTNVKMK